MKRLAIVAACFLVPTLAAQQQGAFRGGTQTVPIYATVLDSTGRLVSDLERKHFAIYDDLKPIELSLFQSEVQPVTVVVMLDTSGSMTLALELLKQAAEQFVIRLLPQDKARIGSFSDKIKLSSKFTSDRDELIRIIHEDIEFGNPTFLWDAVNVSMDSLSKVEGRRVVLVFTDGEDDKSQQINFDQLLARAQGEDTMIYAIGLRNTLMGRTFKPDPSLRKLSDATGGGYFELSKTTDLATTFTRIADELHRQYVMAFSPATLDGKLHLLDVRVKVDGMTARARKSYMAKGGLAPAPLPPQR